MTCQQKIKHERSEYLILPGRLTMKPQVSESEKSQQKIKHERTRINKESQNEEKSCNNRLRYH